MIAIHEDIHNIVHDDIRSELRVVTFDIGVEGPTLVALGAIHGNEPCGKEALDKLERLMRSGEVALTKGKVVFVPVCNPEAFRLNVRMLDPKNPITNLGRYFVPHHPPRCYEDRLRNVLCRIVKDADILPDFHSYQAEGEEFVSLGSSAGREVAWARAAGIRNFVHGWAKLFEESADPEEGISVVQYARQFGKPGVLAMTFECGSHRGPETAENAFRIALRSLEDAGMASFDPALLPAASNAPERCFEMTKRVKKKQVGHLAKAWSTLELVRAGAVLATYDDDKSQEITEEDRYVLLAVDEEPTGADWFFLAKASEDFPPAP
jgi:predicted deacylase